MLLKSYIEKVRLYNIDNVSSVVEAAEFLRAEYNLPSDILLKFEQNGRVLSSESPPPSLTSPVSVFLSGGLPGGKGGFGSLLRSIGAQIEKTTNHEAMR